MTIPMGQQRDHEQDPFTVPGEATAPDALRLLRGMLRIRRFEERCMQLYTQERIRGFLHLYIGQEAVAVGVLDLLAPQDSVVATYREHGHALARGVPAGAVMAEMFAKVEGTSRGRGGSMHIFDAAHRFYGGNAIVASGIPLAVGLALANRMRERDAVTVCFFGEGAVAEGEFHESLNLAALWRLPVLFCCENNLYAMGTALSRSQSQADIALKAAVYGLTAWPVDGMDVLAVRAAAARALEAVRNGGGPHLLELRTYRFRAHSMYDPERYREKQEVREWMHRDPIDLLTAALREHGGLDDPGLATLEAEVATEVDAAVEYADAGHDEPVQDLTRFVYAEGSTAVHDAVQRRER
jgi:pyruvate dehydrogenase E1 component alpha subunit